MTTRTSAICLALLALAAAPACGGSRQDRERAALRKETSPDELFKQGEAAAATGDMTRAEQYFVAALKTGGDERVLVKKLLVVCVADQRYPVALDYAEQYLHRHPGDMEVLFATASLHAATGNVPRARALLERVVQERPKWADAHYALATVLRQDGDATTRADEQDLEYLRLDPTGPLAEAARARLTKTGP